MRNNWKKAKLEDLIELQRGFDLPKSKRSHGHYPLITSSGQDGTHNIFKVKGPGVVTGRSGTLGIVSWVGKDFWPLNTTLWVKDYKGNDKKFAYYFLCNFPLKEYNGGSGVPTLNRNHIHPLPITLPPLPEQKAIAGVLSSLDDKIELLREQNKTLESIAQAVFKEWFVDSVDDKMLYEELGNYVTVRRGGSPRPIKDFVSKEGLNWLKISDATASNSPYIFNIKEKIKKEGLTKTVLLKQGALVLSNSASPGIPKFLAVDSCVHDGWLYFPKSKVSKEFLYLLFLEYKDDLLQQGSGSVFKNLKTDIIRKLKIKVPDTNDMIRFEYFASSIFDKIYKNQKQIQCLCSYRDKLLPTLISGKIRII